MKRIRDFLKNEDGNYAAILALSALPIFGAVGLSVDYANVTRLKSELRDSADASCIAVAKAYLSGDFPDTEVMTLGQDFFFANFVSTGNFIQDAELRITLPNATGNTERLLKCEGRVTYKTIFGPVLAGLTRTPSAKYVYVIEESTMRMKNVAEIALVMDNSGSMSESTVTGGSRLALLKSASKKLVEDLVKEGVKLTNTSDAVKFSVVPFAGAVNVGNANATATWMDTRGISPSHHENFDWGVMGPANPTGWRSVGADGAKLDASGNPLTRFSILNNLKFYNGGTEIAGMTGCKVWKPTSNTSATSIDTSSEYDSACTVKDRTGGTAIRVVGGTAAEKTTLATTMGTTTAALEAEYGWGGCVESRPYPYNINDTTPDTGVPATLIVPMFAPDEYNDDRYGATSSSSTSMSTSTLNNWWPDETTTATKTYTTAPGAYLGTGSPSATFQTATGRPRMVNVAKYFQETLYLLGSSGASATTTSTSYKRKGQWHYFKAGTGPNYGCSTPPILPLTGTQATVTTAIDAMVANGSTNVTEGLAWGWRTISKNAPFTNGTDMTNKAVDKVIIVFTDGRNTYYSPSDLGAKDYANHKSFYGPYGYAGYVNKTTPGTVGAATSATNKARMYEGTTASPTTYTFDNYTTGMIQQMNQLCSNIKATDKILLMTVGLDLDPAPAADGPMITALSACAGDSRTRKTPAGAPKKMFWNACTQPTSTSGCTTLEDTMNQIKDELSNLRFVG